MECSGQRASKQVNIIFQLPGSALLIAGMKAVVNNFCPKEHLGDLTGEVC